jgi:hypothetical protein
VRFVYPGEDEKFLASELKYDFLRSRAGSPDLFDEKYLLNQRDAANFFLSSVNDSLLNYKNILKIQHRLCALGLDGRRAYSISINSREWSVPSLQRGRVVYSDPLKMGFFREVYPGILRSELKAIGVPHVSRDGITLDLSDYELINGLNVPEAVIACFSLANGRQQFVSNIEKNFCVEITDSGLISRPTLVRIKVDLGEEGLLWRNAPTDAAFTACLLEAGQRLRRITSTLVNFHQMDSQRKKFVSFIESIADYYHCAINLMPFSSINNSIIFSHINCFLRSAGWTGIPHGHLDSVALVSSEANFRTAFTRYVEANFRDGGGEVLGAQENNYR